MIAREFFLQNRRRSTPKAPACEKCNGSKGALEHYLTTVLPFGGRHSDALVNLSTMVPKRLSKNAALHRELATGMKQGALFLLDRDGSWGHPMTLPFDPRRLERLFAMISQGLAWFHWGVLLPDGYSLIAGIFSDRGAAFFEDKLFRTRAKARVYQALGGDTFVYEGMQADGDPNLTIWRFSIYGGVSFTGDPKLPGQQASLIVAVTAANPLIQKLNQTIFNSELRPTRA